MQQRSKKNLMLMLHGKISSYLLQYQTSQLPGSAGTKHIHGLTSSSMPSDHQSPLLCGPVW